MKEKRKALIAESEEHTFHKNSYHSKGNGVFSKPNAEMLAWIAECEDVILTNFGKYSTPRKKYEEFDIRSLENNYQSGFEKQIEIIVSVLKICYRLYLKTEIKERKLDATKVFIVHGHDGELKSEVARFIEKLGLEPIILHEKASSGKTIIEKIEDYTDVGFGIVLYTPCDVGAKNTETPNLKPRARQNVVFEHGFLIGKIGRKNVCALVKGEVEKPNDVLGVVYVSMSDNWKIALAKEMKDSESKYDIDMNLVI